MARDHEWKSNHRPPRSTRAIQWKAIFDLPGTDAGTLRGGPEFRGQTLARAAVAMRLWRGADRCWHPMAAAGRRVGCPHARPARATVLCRIRARGIPLQLTNAVAAQCSLACSNIDRSKCVSAQCALRQYPKRQYPKRQYPKRQYPKRNDYSYSNAVFDLNQSLVVLFVDQSRKMLQAAKVMLRHPKNPQGLESRDRDCQQGYAHFGITAMSFAVTAEGLGS